MEYRNLGATGLKVSVIGFGTGSVSQDPVEQENLKQLVKKAYDSGVNFFDTAEQYNEGNSEIALGKAFKELNLPREQLVVSTKLFWGPRKGPNDIGLSRKHVIEGAKNSLKRLQLDYVDVIFCHRPDFETPVEETCRAFDYLINNGKAFYWGTSEWPVERIMEAHRVCDKLGLHKPIVEQPEYNLLTREKMEKEYLQLFQNHGMGATVWSPLAGGALSGKYNDGIPKGARYDNENPLFKMLYDKYFSQAGTRPGLQALAEVAKEIGSNQAQVAYAWVLNKSNVSVCLLGASKISQLEENLKAIETAKKLTPELMEKIEKAFGNAPVQHMNFKAWNPLK